MYTSVMSASMQGLEAVLVQVEVDVSNGFPGFFIVGNPNSQVREAQDRVRYGAAQQKYQYASEKNHGKSVSGGYSENRDSI